VNARAFTPAPALQYLASFDSIVQKSQASSLQPASMFCHVNFYIFF